MSDDAKRFLGETIQFVEETNTQGDSVLVLQGMTNVGISDYSELVQYGIADDMLDCLYEHARVFGALANWNKVAADILKTYGNARVLQAIHNAGLCIQYLIMAQRVTQASDIGESPSAWRRRDVGMRVANAMTYYSLLDTVDKYILEHIRPELLAQIGNYTSQLFNAGYDVEHIPFNRSNK